MAESQSPAAMDQDHCGIGEWFKTLGIYVAACDFEGACGLFDEGVIGFGSRTTVTGLDNPES